MDRMFSISQVAQMLGLGIDAVRFYEKKGLVHPQVNPKNRYRMYSVYQIMELLDVGYYRGLGMSIEQIRSIYDQCDEEQLMHLLHQKRLETEKKDPLRAAVAQADRTCGINCGKDSGDGGEYRYSDLSPERYSV